MSKIKPEQPDKSFQTESFENWKGLEKQERLFICPNCHSQNTLPVKDFKHTFEMECRQCHQIYQPEPSDFIPHPINLSQLFYYRAQKELNEEKPDLISIKAKFEQALDLILEEVKKGLKEPDTIDYLAMLYFWLASVCLELDSRKEDDLAIVYLTKCLRYIEQSRKKHRTSFSLDYDGTVYMQMAQAYRRLQQKKAALNADKKAARCFEAFLKEADTLKTKNQKAIDMAYFYLLQTLFCLIPDLIKEKKEKPAIRTLNQFISALNHPPKNYELDQSLKNAGLSLAYGDLFFLAKESRQVREKAKADFYLEQREKYLQLAGGFSSIFSFCRWIDVFDSSQLDEFEQEVAERQKNFWSVLQQPESSSKKEAAGMDPAAIEELRKSYPEAAGSLILINAMEEYLDQADPEELEHWEELWIKEIEACMKKTEKCSFLPGHMARKISTLLRQHGKSAEALRLLEKAIEFGQFYLLTFKNGDLSPVENYLAFLFFDAASILQFDETKWQKTEDYLTKAQTLFSDLKKREQLKMPDVYVATLFNKIRILEDLGKVQEAAKLKESMEEEFGTETLQSFWKKVIPLDEEAK